MSAPLRMPHLSERQQVVLIIVMSVAAIAGLWFFLLRPQAQRRHEIQEKWERHRQSEYANMSREELIREEETIEANLASVRSEWDAIRRRLSTYTKAEALEGAHVGNIDYKVELLNERSRLSDKSEQLGIELVPRDLGMQSAVTTQEDARILLLKLRAIEKLADLTLDRRIDRLIAIEPQDPIRHSLPGQDTVFLEEYPIEAEFDVSLDALYDLLHSVFERNHVFVIRQLRVNAGDTPTAPLRVHAVLSALIVK